MASHDQVYFFEHEFELLALSLSQQVCKYDFPLILLLASIDKVKTQCQLSQFSPELIYSHFEDAFEGILLYQSNALVPVITKSIMYQNYFFLILSIFYGKIINYFILIYYKCRTGHSRKQLLAIWQASLVIARQVNSFMVSAVLK